MDWNFIEGTLSILGLPRKVIDLIMQCISTVSYEVLINGIPSSSIKPSCGLRQGDPLSPYIFVLCTEMLSLNLLKAEEDGNLRGTSVCRNSLPLSHLLFADDSIFFVEGHEKSCQVLFSILEKYCRASGQAINHDKSALLISPSSTMSFAKTCMQAPISNSLGTYLGLPSDVGNALEKVTKKCLFNFVIEKIQRRIASWNGILLSPAGRLTLITSVLSSISIYFLSVFKLPVSVSNKIDSMLSHFWWKEGCCPSPKDTELLANSPNLSSLQVRHLINVESLSWDEFRVCCFFEEGWVGKILAIPISLSLSEDILYWNESHGGQYMVKQGYFLAHQRHWNENATRKDLSRLGDDYKMFIKKTLWHLPGPRVWSVLLWKILTDSLPVGYEFQRRRLDRFVLECPMLDTCSTIETTAHLFRDCEVAKRLWLGSYLGIKIVNGLQLDIFKRWIINWTNLLKKSKDNNVGLLSFLCTLWTLWKVRNCNAFGDGCNAMAGCRLYEGHFNLARSVIDNLSPTGPPGFAKTITFDDDSDVLQRLRAGEEINLFDLRYKCIKYSICVDSSWTPSWKIGVGWVCYGLEGSATSCSMSSFAQSPEQAEGRGILEALLWARRMKHLHISIASDCLCLLAQIVEGESNNHLTTTIVPDIMDLAKEFHCISFSFISRSCNVAAHKLAYSASR
ncbi:uncharacterized protein LOC141613522 [Silene latifolia]|uniref:uncharacterized protein LOC141613522 n=1 Tax=Silene latifolia TaxID=37657 RepID=UPI003D76A8D7